MQEVLDARPAHAPREYLSKTVDDAASFKRIYEKRFKRACSIRLFPFRLRCKSIVLHDVELFAGDLISDLLGGEPLKNRHPVKLNLALTKKNLKNGKGIFLLDLILILARQLKVMSLLNDLVRPTRACTQTFFVTAGTPLQYSNTRSPKSCSRLAAR